MENTVEAKDSFGVSKEGQTEYNRKKFVEQLGDLINSLSIENKSNTPDFILAEFLVYCLAAFEATSLRREAWFGVGLDILNNWEELIMTAMGEASMCWSEIDKAGVFDSAKAKQIGEKLLQDIKRKDK